MGLPPLQIRISVHAGEVFLGMNPVTNRKELIGTEVNRAARIEPVVRPNHVYVTKDFVQRCKAENIRFQLLGNIDLPKDWGSEEIYVASWNHEVIEPTNLVSSTMASALKDISVLNYPISSKFGRRLMVSTRAKLAIAQYCATTDFWKAEDIVFVESGTLPTYMILELYRHRDPELRPKLMVTNNLGCLAVAMMAEESGGEAYAIYPEDVPMNWILIGGTVLDDYAATIPEDLISGEEEGFWHSSKLTEFFGTKQVNHVVMMVSRFTRADGPCAVSSAMRRMKKLMLKYVAQNEGVRLSILCEADKIVERRGWPADTIDHSNTVVGQYWEQVLKNRKTSVITAISPEMTRAQIALVKRELNELSLSGASCVCLGETGEIVNLENS
jgi:hypothetical protein